MDTQTNPYAPGAGTPPPELAGRGDLLESTALALDRIRNGHAAKSLLIVGLRGVGKTVLLNRIASDAEGRGFETVSLETPEDRSLPGLIAPPLHVALLKMNRRAAVGDAAARALRALGGFVRSMRVRYHDLELGMDLRGEPGLADSGDFQSDLTALLRAVGEAARTRGTALVLFVDELQYLKKSHLSALIVALHQMAQLGLPVTLVGAGLPQLVVNAGAAKSYAERLFDFPEIGPLEVEAATHALKAPAERLGVAYDPAAIEALIHHTQGLPYFLQEWGRHCWEIAKASPITVADVETATDIVMAALDASFFRVRFARLMETEKPYLRAMAELGNGPHRSGDIARVFNKSAAEVAALRSRLIKKGMIYSPSYGMTAFAVPKFDDYLKRVMPLEEPDNSDPV